MSGARISWNDLDPAAMRALQLAHQSLLAGGLAVGSVIVANEHVVAEGRNRAYDPATGTDPLERTPLAHAEMNALARLNVDTDVSSLTLWSTQQPCPMCQAAIDFVGIESLSVIATDPSAPTHRANEAVDEVWVILATAMFLIGPLRLGGERHPMVLENQVLEPESTDLAKKAVRASAHPLLDGRPLPRAVDAMWADLSTAADRRRSR
jgi:tRNA(Arg) A34 adenosine deaminase TadA